MTMPSRVYMRADSELDRIPPKHRDLFRDDKGWLVCTLCDKMCNGLDAAQIHVESKTHRNKVQSSVSELHLIPAQHRDCFCEVDGWLLCTVCNAKCDGAEKAQTHVDGQKHKRNVRNEAWKSAQPPRWSQAGRDQDGATDSGPKGDDGATDSGPKGDDAWGAAIKTWVDKAACKKVVSVEGDQEGATDPGQKAEQGVKALALPWGGEPELPAVTPAQWVAESRRWRDAYSAQASRDNERIRDLQAQGFGKNGCFPCAGCEPAFAAMEESFMRFYPEAQCFECGASGHSRRDCPYQLADMCREHGAQVRASRQGDCKDDFLCKAWVYDRSCRHGRQCFFRHPSTECYEREPRRAEW